MCLFSAPTTADDTSDSDSDSEIVITSRSTAEFNHADTLVRKYKKKAFLALNLCSGKSL